MNIMISKRDSNRQECIVYSRVVGWMTPLKNWNKGKRAEFEDRKEFILKKEQDK